MQLTSGCLLFRGSSPGDYRGRPVLARGWRARRGGMSSIVPAAERDRYASQSSTQCGGLVCELRATSKALSLKQLGRLCGKLSVSET